MKHAISAVSTLLQLAYLIGLFALLYSVLLVFRVDGLAQIGDPKLMAGEISHALVTFLLRACIGLIGVSLAWYSLRVKGPAPDWFIKISKTFAFAWFVFVPIGTALGFFMLRWIKPDSGKEAAA